MARRRLGWMLVCAVAVAAVASVGAAVAGNGTTDARLRGWVASLSVPTAGASFRGAPPSFAIPAGGSATIEANDLGRKVSLRRADGTLFAAAVVDDSGRVPEAWFYDTHGKLTSASDAYYVRAGDRYSCGDPCSLPGFTRP